VPRKRRLKLAQAIDITPAPKQLQLPDNAVSHSCGHCPELQRLIHEMSGINNCLHIILRAMMGQQK